MAKVVDASSAAQQGAPEGSSAKEGGVLGKVKDFIIDTVNPKFRWFDKPLLLAAIVGSTTAVFTLILFFSMVTQCSELSESVIHADLVFVAEAAEQWAASKAGFQCAFMAHINHEEVPGSSVWNEIYQCAPPGITMCGYPSETQKRSVPVAERDLKLPIIAEEHESGFPECVETSSWGWHIKPTIEYKVCPGVAATFGSALGNAGLIEVAITAVVVGVLQATGVLKGKEFSAVGKWLMETAKEEMKDNGKQQAEIDALKKEVQELRQLINAKGKK